MKVLLSVQFAELTIVIKVLTDKSSVTEVLEEDSVSGIEAEEKELVREELE